MQERNGGDGQSGVEDGLREVPVPVEDRIDEVVPEDVGSAEAGVDDRDEAVEQREDERPDEVSRPHRRLSSDDEDVREDDDGVEAVLVDVGVEPLVVVVRVVEEDPEGERDDQRDADGDVAKDLRHSRESRVRVWETDTKFRQA